MQTQTIIVPASEADEIQGWLDSGKQIPDAGETETVKTYTAVFMDDFEADIKVCNGDTGPYIDAVLFEEGCEVKFLAVRDTFLGVYIFKDVMGLFQVIVEKQAA